MMIKRILLIIVIFVTSIALATLSLENTNIKGYFDYDDYLDEFKCGGGYLVERRATAGNESTEAYEYQCIFSLKDKVLPFVVRDNWDCSTLELLSGDERGEVIIKCGNHGIGRTFYYQYNKNYSNWFLVKRELETLPMGPDSRTEFTIDTDPKESWSIDKTMLIIPGKRDLLSLKSIIRERYEKKYFEDVKALVRVVDLDNLEISIKNVTDYNNIAYFLEQSGASKEAIIILEQIIKKFPERVVAYINIGDAYWAEDNKKQAQKAYRVYSKKMQNIGQTKRIPKIIRERLKM